LGFTEIVTGLASDGAQISWTTRLLGVSGRGDEKNPQGEGMSGITHFFTLRSYVISIAWVMRIAPPKDVIGGLLVLVRNELENLINCHA
jgi:hypothetical protein